MSRKADRKPILYQIKITLKHARPPIWRRIQVRADITLEDLHDILQTVMGWEDAHQHLFIASGEEYGHTDPEFGATVKDESEAVLAELVKEGECLVYVYDFGDEWEHDLLIERVLPAEVATRLPCCIAGERACPPEDCGGPHGYAHLLAAFADPKHESHEDILDWLGDDLDLDPRSLRSRRRQCHSSAVINGKTGCDINEIDAE